MQEIEIGDAVEVAGDTQDYILTEPGKTYRGRVMGKEGGQLLVRLEEPVVRGQSQFREATVPASRARKIAGKES